MGLETIYPILEILLADEDAEMQPKITFSWLESGVSGKVSYANIRPSHLEPQNVHLNR